VQSHDQAAWEILARLYGPVVYRWVRASGANSHDAGDIVQNVFVLLLRKIDRFGAAQAGASFRGWLWTVTRNAVLEFRRRQMQQPAGIDREQVTVQAVMVDDLPEEMPESQQMRLILTHRALDLVKSSVDPATWELFWRTTLLNEAASDVAVDLGMTPQAVRQGKYRVLCRLRNLLADA
jgi:RNA polymerase sigma-70 factor (ECF subfamily)